MRPWLLALVCCSQNPPLEGLQAVVVIVVIVVIVVVIAIVVVLTVVAVVVVVIKANLAFNCHYTTVPLLG